MVVAWNASLWRKNTSLERQLHELGERIRPAGAAGIQKSGRGPSALAAMGPDLHWKESLGRLGDLRGRGEIGDLLEIAALLRGLSGLSTADLVETLGSLDEIAADPVSRRQMENLLADSLIAKDPQLALASLAGRLREGDQPFVTRLAAALGEWARKDATAAAAWLDQRIAAGDLESRSLEGKSAARMDFEAALLETLLVSDRDAARQRIASLPEDHRRETLERIAFNELPPEGQLGYASVARESVPVDEFGGVIAHLTSSVMAHGGFQEAGSLLDRIQASPAERGIAARQAAFDHLGAIATERPISREDLEPLGQWLARQAPGQAPRVTAEAIAEAAAVGGEFNVSEAAGLVDSLHQESGDDALIEAFLRRLAARSISDGTQHLLDRISDPVRRAELLEEIR